MTTERYPAASKPSLNPGSDLEASEVSIAEEVAPRQLGKGTADNQLTQDAMAGNSGSDAICSCGTRPAISWSCSTYMAAAFQQGYLFPGLSSRTGAAPRLPCRGIKGAVVSLRKYVASENTKASWAVIVCGKMCVNIEWFLDFMGGFYGCNIGRRARGSHLDSSILHDHVRSGLVFIVQ
ncbi:hypothetical protein LX36DRAFT_486517 [Colletotrichum falcatum]|nr:hypothetical protein LX36DRAFT_486517 [Colletotrichum falcatum]